MELTGGAGKATFLAALEPETRAALHERGRPQCYRAGAVLLYEGQLEAPVVIVLEGMARVSTIASDGRELVLASRTRVSPR